MTSQIPFSEPPYLAGLPSAYYARSHLQWQKACRSWLDEHFTQHCMDWERNEEVPEHVFQDFSRAHMLLPSLPAPLPVAWLKKLGIHDILGIVKVEDWDYLHTAIFCDEVISLEDGQKTVHAADAAADGQKWTRWPVGFDHHRHGVRRPTAVEIREYAAARKVPARLITRQKEDMHSYHGA